MIVTIKPFRDNEDDAQLFENVKHPLLRNEKRAVTRLVFKTYNCRYFKAYICPSMSHKIPTLCAKQCTVLVGPPPADGGCGQCSYLHYNVVDSNPFFNPFFPDAYVDPKANSFTYG